MEKACYFCGSIKHETTICLLNILKESSASSVRSQWDVNKINDVQFKAFLKEDYRREIGICSIHLGLDGKMGYIWACVMPVGEAYDSSKFEEYHQRNLHEMLFDKQIEVFVKY